MFDNSDLVLSGNERIGRKARERLHAACAGLASGYVRNLNGSDRLNITARVLEVVGDREHLENTVNPTLIAHRGVNNGVAGVGFAGNNFEAHFHRGHDHLGAETAGWANLLVIKGKGRVASLIVDREAAAVEFHSDEDVRVELHAGDPSRFRCCECVDGGKGDESDDDCVFHFQILVWAPSGRRVVFLCEP
jgi:hypothetical protein